MAGLKVTRCCLLGYMWSFCTGMNPDTCTCTSGSRSDTLSYKIDIKIKPKFCYFLRGHYDYLLACWLGAGTDRTSKYIGSVIRSINCKKVVEPKYGIDRYVVWPLVHSKKCHRRRYTHALCLLPVADGNYICKKSNGILYSPCFHHPRIVYKFGSCLLHQ